jgi:hypothetical protein
LNKENTDDDDDDDDEDDDFPVLRVPEGDPYDPVAINW